MLATTLPTVIGMGVVAETVRRTFPRQGKGGGKGSAHYHFKGKSRVAVRHTHPGGHISHKHTGLLGYGRTKGTLKR